MNQLLAMAPSGEGGSSLMSLVPLILMFAVFYFLLIAPARKKQKSQQEMRNGLKAGDKVITNGGIHGTVVGVSDNVIQLRIADQVKIDISKFAIEALQSPTE
ncbi:MAG: preprotein translocase subunit YajC [Acidobacteria bacterium]|nr:preprotein translocase subunit YajC [Acidobacteriota bacterium]NIM64177.1 preprotein translocase subunit YajC [Acidobacteriota bacterium]NIO60999.1 preprotein translocase subunit YajC [Acidobacteriota bacterium]NIQ32012.1 preprotein translocase subunit YajC [Acidobacteriota bacterium]NIQ87508.1 preprotein translocase subunit YajC [Acidobacteriota bacterium]